MNTHSNAGHPSPASPGASPYAPGRTEMAGMSPASRRPGRFPDPAWPPRIPSQRAPSLFRARTLAGGVFGHRRLFSEMTE